MTAATTAQTGRHGRMRGAALAGLGLAAGALLGAVVSVGVDTGSMPFSLLLAGAMALIVVLLFALASLDLAVAAGFATLGVVLIEPAPPDGIFIVVFAVSLLTHRFHVRRAPAIVVGLVGLFIVTNFLSLMGAGDPFRGVRYLAITIYLGTLAIWLTGWLDSRRKARLIVLAYIGGAIPVAVLASVALFIPFPGSEFFLLEDGRRSQGLTKDANVYGPFLVPAALLLLSELLDRRLLKIRRPFIFAMIAILAVGTLFSYSRAAWLNFILGVIVMLGATALRRRGGRRAVVMAVAGLTIVLVAAMTITVTGSGEFLAERAQLHGYDQDRFGTQASGLTLADRHALGVGPGQFELVQPQSAHSLYVRVLAEQGYLGFAFLIALLAVTFVLACGNVIAGRDTWGIGSAALLGAWCGLLSNSAFVDTLHWRHLWVVAALVWAGSARRFTHRG